MLTKQIIQTCIDELCAISKVDFCVADEQGLVLANTLPKGEINPEVMNTFFVSPADSQIVDGNYYFKVKDGDELFYVLLAKGNQADAYTFGRVAVNELKHLLIAYREQYSHNSFFQNLILDNLLLVDIHNRAKKLGLNLSEQRVVFLLECPSDRQRDAAEVLRSAYAEHMQDCVTTVDEKTLILIHSLQAEEGPEEIQDMAETILSVMNTEVLVDTRVSYGTVISELKEVSKSYKEAKMALDVGEIFYPGRNVVAYANLGIGRLIYQLPVQLCQMFIREIFGQEIPEELDEETLNTVDKFFENSLNVSETSRQLYVHRNTLVYRIEKLAKATGLDIRVFDDALTLKIALMVVNYMAYLDRE